MTESRPSPHARVVANYQAGWTVEELARRTGWSKQAVCLTLLRNDVELRDDIPLNPLTRARRLLRRDREASGPDPKAWTRLVTPAEPRRDEVLQAELQRRRNEEEAKRRRDEQGRLNEFIARHTKTRDTLAAYSAEVEFGRRERAALADWLKNYGDILTGEH